MIGFNHCAAQIPQDWPLKLAQAWPSLLINLLDQEHGESLERLQLLSIDVNSEALAPGIKRYTVGVDNFLELSSELSLGPKAPKRAVIKYFVRGSRKFYMPSARVGESQSWLDAKPIEADQVQEFFAGLGHANSCFYHAGLAELNGRPMGLVPNQMVVTMLLQACLRAWPAGHSCLERFSFTFLMSVAIGQRLKLGFELDSKGLNLVLYAGDNPVLLLKAECL